MRVKPSLVTVMSEKFPDFPLHLTKGNRYFFSRSSNGKLFEHIVFQRDGKAGAFYVDLAITYDPDWRGNSPGPLGRWASLAELKRGRSFINAIEHWYTYGNSKDNLQQILGHIINDITRFGLPFFRDKRKELNSNAVLQHGFSIIQETGPLSQEEWEQLDADLKVANWHVTEIKNEKFEELKAKLNKYAKETKSSLEQLIIDRIAFDLLWIRFGEKRMEG